MRTERERMHGSSFDGNVWARRALSQSPPGDFRMAAPALRPLSTGEVLDVSFGLYRSLFFTLVVVTTVSRLVPTVLGIYLNVSGGVLEHWVLGIVQFLVSIILGALGVAATTFIVSGAYLGQEISAEAALHAAWGLIGRLILLSLMTSLVIGVGVVLLIVPGVILLSGLLLSTVALVLEQPLTATGAMSRSWELTRGFRGKALLTLLVAALLLLIPTMIVGVLAGIATLLGIPSQLLVQVLAGVLQIFVYPFMYVALTVLYYDLRVRKEGFDLELLATATQPA
jgi:phage shock protein PspC (stress-responsive transcriptional regulator)